MNPNVWPLLIVIGIPLFVCLMIYGAIIVNKRDNYCENHGGYYIMGRAGSACIKKEALIPLPR